MAEHETVVIEVAERGYIRDGIRYHPGDLLEVPAYAVPSITEANPPFGRVVGDLEEATRPVDATDAARALADEEGVDLGSLEGTGEDGRVLKSDVEAALDSG